MPNLSYIPESNRFVFHGRDTYSHKHAPKGAGFRWNPEKKIWWTDSFDNAIKLKHYADPECQKKLKLPDFKEVLSGLYEGVKHSDLPEADVPLPSWRDDLVLMHHQKQMVHMFSEIPGKGMLLADYMRLGKTISALAACNYMGFGNVLVLTPATNRLDWVQEAQKWRIQDGYSKALLSGRDWIGSGVSTVVCSYDYLRKKKNMNRLLAMDWDCVIPDEAHKLKNMEAKRTKAFLEHILPKVGKVLHLTGTPILNRMDEFWIYASTLLPDVFPSKGLFENRYCSWDGRGAANSQDQERLEEFIQLIKPVTLRRTRQDIGDMPNVVRTTIPLDGSQVRELLTRERNTWEEVKELREQGKYREAMEVGGSLATDRRELGEAKVPAVIAHCREILEQGEKVVVFAHHRNVVRELREGLGKWNPLVIDGQTPPTARFQYQNDFRDGHHNQVLIGSIHAAAHALRLDTCNNVVFAELDWTPAMLDQCEERVQAMGKETQINVDYLVYEDSVDDIILGTLGRKRNLITTVMGGLNE